MFGEVQRHLDGVLHIEEVAQLFAVLELGLVALEELHASGAQNLLVGLVDERAHLALMIFVGPENVEVFHAHDARQPADALRMQVEQVFGVAIHVQRPQPVQVLVLVVHALRSVAIRGGRGGIDEAGALLQRPACELLGVAEIIIGQIARVLLRGGGAGAEMEHRRELAEHRGVLGEVASKIARLHVIREFKRHEILPFFIGAQEIRHDDVGVSALIQGPDQRAADKTGATRHKYAAIEGTHSSTTNEH